MDNFLKRLEALFGISPPNTEIEIVQKDFKLHFKKASIPPPQPSEIKPLPQAKLKQSDQEKKIFALSPAVGWFSVYYKENNKKRERKIGDIITSKAILCVISALGQNWPIVLNELIKKGLLKLAGKENGKEKLTALKTDRFVIEEILVKNGQTVEYMEPLFILKPA